MAANWDTLKKITNSKLAKYTIIIPIMGWILVYNDNLIHLLEGILGRNIDFEFSWRLHIFYIGLALISITAVIYICMCPREIDHSQDIQDFVRKEITIYTREYDKKIAAIIEEEPLEWALPSSGVGEFDLDSLVRINEEKIIDRLEKLYSIRNSAYSFARGASIVIFVAGAIMVSMPTVVTLGWSSCSASALLPNGSFFREIENACSTLFSRSEDVLKDVQ